MIERLPSWAALVDAAADRLAEALEAGLAERGRASLALAGGSTPGDIYRRLSGRALDWSRVGVTLTDERWVEPNSPDSNARLVLEALLTGPAARARFIPLKPDGTSQLEAPAEAEAALADLWPLDSALLGMGADGHFASLFPGSPALDMGLAPHGPARVVAAPAGAPAPPQPRLSLTLSALRDARGLLLAIRGAEKLSVLERAEIDGLPVAALLRHAPVQVLWAP